MYIKEVLKTTNIGNEVPVFIEKLGNCLMQRNLLITIIMEYIEGNNRKLVRETSSNRRNYK